MSVAYQPSASRMQWSELLPYLLQYLPGPGINPELPLSTLSVEQRAAFDALVATSDLNPWVVLANVAQQCMREWVLDLTEQIACTNWVDRNSADWQVARLLEDMGFEVPQHVIDLLGATHIAPLLPTLLRSATDANTENWHRVLGALLGGPLTVTPLYTEDYISFVAQPFGTTIHEGGTWWRTNQRNVSLSYDSFQHTVGYDMGTFTPDVARSMVESHMPINLVLHTFGFDVQATVNLPITVLAMPPSQSASSATTGYDPYVTRIRRYKTPN